MRTVYIGNLARTVSDQDLTALFLPFGGVNWANVVRSKISEASQGFGFVEMESELHADAAILGLQGSILKGKRLKINQAKPKCH